MLIASPENGAQLIGALVALCLYLLLRLGRAHA